MQGRVKNILLSFILIMLVAPLLQSTFKLFKPQQLYGYFITANDIDFSMQGWLDATYQDQKSKYLNDHFGFREDFVRLNNQIDLSLFNKLNADAVLGKERYLFQECYIKEHFGITYWGEDSIRILCTGLKYLQDRLSKEHKSFLVVYPATKDDFYPEYLPYHPNYHNTSKRNAIVYKRLCDSFGINHIDIDSIIIAKKNKSPELLFTKEGTHWSMYTGALAADTIIRYIEHLRNVKLPELKITSVEHTDKAKFTDNDIGWSLNLIYPFAKERYSYPVVTFDSTGVTNKPNLVLVGDSYNWTLITEGLMKAFAQWQFWYYFKNVKKVDNMDAALDALNMNGYDWRAALDSTDCIIINYAPHNIDQLYSFVDSATKYYYLKQKKQ